MKNKSRPETVGKNEKDPPPALRAVEDLLLPLVVIVLSLLPFHSLCWL